jgi:hypothetical protein
LEDGVLRVDCPTDHFKQSLRKVVLEFNDQAPALPEFEGLVASWRTGNRLEIVLVGYGSLIWKMRLLNTHVALVEVFHFWQWINIWTSEFTPFDAGCEYDHCTDA